MVGIKRVSVVAAVVALSCSSAVAQSAEERNVSVDTSLNTDLSAGLSIGEIALPQLQLPVSLTPQEVVEQLELYLLKSDVILGQFDMPALGSFLPAMPGMSFQDMIDCELQIPLVGDLADACESLRPTISNFFTQRLSNGLQLPVQEHLESIIDGTAVKSATDAVGETLGSITNGSVAESLDSITNGNVADSLNLDSITNGYVAESLNSITRGSVAESLESITSGSVADSLEAIAGKKLSASGSVSVDDVAETTRAAFDNVDSSFREAGEKLVAAGESFVSSFDEHTNSLASQVGAAGGLGAVREAVVGRLRGSAPSEDVSILPKFDTLPELSSVIPEVAANLSLTGEEVIRAIEEAGLTLPSTQIIDQILVSGDKEPLLAARATLEEFLRSTNQIILDGAKEISEAGLILHAEEAEEVDEERRLQEVEAEEAEAARALQEIEAEEIVDRRLAEAEAEVEDRRLGDEEDEAEVEDRRLDAEEAEVDAEASVTLAQVGRREVDEETARSLQAEEEAEDDENAQ